MVAHLVEHSLGTNPHKLKPRCTCPLLSPTSEWAKQFGRGSAYEGMVADQH